MCMAIYGDSAAIAALIVAGADIAATDNDGCGAGLCRWGSAPKPQSHGGRRPACTNE